MRLQHRMFYRKLPFRSIGRFSGFSTVRQRTTSLYSSVQVSARIYGRTSNRLLFLSTTPDNLTESGDEEDNAEHVGLEADGDDEQSSFGSGKTVEERYSRKTPLEHVLLRPSMYVGPNERLPAAPVWVLANDDADDSDAHQNLRMEQREYGLVPALIKVFDEILVNASDNRLRHPKQCTELHVTIDRGSGPKGAMDASPPCITIRNNGPGIPIQMHKEEQMYVPELLFGHLLTGSNFDDDEKRLTGGRHGYGAKLANIFSRRFTVETSDGKQTYRQTWHDNMRRADPPIISKSKDATKKRGGSYTMIEFEPDLERLNQTGSSSTISEGDYNYMCRRVVDIAGCGGSKNFSVFLNGRDVSLRDFGEYCQLYQSSEEDNPGLVCQSVNTRWKVAVGKSESNNTEIVSFVNGVHTARGGSHVNLVLQQVTKRILDKVETSSPELAKLITPTLVRRHLFIGCDARIENPTFDSQMKECLTSNPSSFGSTCHLPDAFLNKIVKAETSGGLGIVEELLRVAHGRQQANLLKHSGNKVTRRQLLGIPKLEDAHLAGCPGELTTIILTEGDSAKALAVSGLEVVGRERFGVFPLRGKFLNVRDASISQLTRNQEVKALVAILGLDFEKTYESAEEREELRYGRVLLMTDQDTDGSHIKGLVMNFFRHFWPALLLPVQSTPDNGSSPTSFLAAFTTPLLKVSKKSKNEKLEFYAIGEYRAWRSGLGPDELKKWSVKYYKGLGTSTSEEAKAYFSAFDKNLRLFRWKSAKDGELLDLVFDKGRAADRRAWILDEYDDEAVIEEEQSAEGTIVSFEDFVNKEMIHFSNADNIRSIPSVIDGLKPSQRKVLFACFKRNLKKEVKVAQLTGYCAEHTAYHHGEASLQATIIGMAQDFVGSNNINLLAPSGQFGTRLTGGSDAASPRYIFTHLKPITRRLFPEEDDVLLAHKEDDGQSIEPEFYCPVIPLLLVNGTQGIGTGWSTNIPPHNPLDVVRYLQAKLDGDLNLPPIRPYARGFDGQIELSNDGKSYVTLGRATKKTKKSVLVDELPLRCWTNSYKETLLKLRGQGTISSFVENHTTAKVSFLVSMNPSKLAKMEKTGFERGLKLRTILSLTNMHAFDESGVIRKYARAEDIVEAYFPVRLRLYHDRKSVLESEATYAAALCRNKARFIESVTQGKIDLISGKKTRAETTKELHDEGFATHAELMSLRNDNAVFRRRLGHVVDEDTTKLSGDLGEGQDTSGYDYLLNMPLSSLSTDRIASLVQDAAVRDGELAAVKRTTATDLWKQDLEKLLPFLD